MDVALLQMDVVDGDPAANLACAERLLEQTGRADLAVLPELWTTGYAHGSWPEAAAEWTPRVLERLAAIAAAASLRVAGSMVSVTEGGGLANRLWIVAPDGTREHYDKAHLFPPMGEPGRLEPGRRAPILDIDGWKVAPALCYDLRYPGMFRAAALEGAELFLVASAWPEPRCATLDLLTRARAVENQAWGILCNRAAKSADGTRFCGGSMVVAPDGEVIVRAGAGPAVHRVSLDRDAVARARRALPVLEGETPVDRRASASP